VPIPKGASGERVEGSSMTFPGVQGGPREIHPWSWPTRESLIEEIQKGEQVRILASEGEGVAFREEGKRAVAGEAAEVRISRPGSSLQKRATSHAPQGPLTAEMLREGGG
jgi:hypothetical protein